MPCKVLIRATTNGKWLKGYPVSLMGESTPWGTAEVLPSYVRLNISDADVPEVQHLLDAWRSDFAHEIINQNDLGYRIKISVDQRVIGAFGTESGLKQHIVDVLGMAWGAVLISRDADNLSATFDVPKPVDLQELKAFVRDIFEQDVDRRINYFTEDEVDLVIAAGGEVTLTLAQVIIRVKNRMVD